MRRSVANSNYRHGHRGPPMSPTYETWRGMKHRCKADPYYVEHKIKVCERWEKFKNFLEDMGERPDGKEIDRYPDPAGDYEPGNCRWATQSQQSKNREKWKWKRKRPENWGSVLGTLK